MRIGMTIPSMIEGVDRDRFLAWCRRVDEGPARFAPIVPGDVTAVELLRSNVVVRVVKRVKATLRIC